MYRFRREHEIAFFRNNKYSRYHIFCTTYLTYSTPTHPSSHFIKHSSILTGDDVLLDSPSPSPSSLHRRGPSWLVALPRGLGSSPGVIKTSSAHDAPLGTKLRTTFLGNNAPHIAPHDATTLRTTLRTTHVLCTTPDVPQVHTTHDILHNALGTTLHTRHEVHDTRSDDARHSIPHDALGTTLRTARRTTLRTHNTRRSTQRSGTY